VEIANSTPSDNGLPSVTTADNSPLRRKIRGLIGGLKDHATHERLPELCEQLGLPSPDAGPSKRDRLYASVDALADEDLPRVANSYLSGFSPSAEMRNEIQELVWALSTYPEVPVRFRREVAVALENESLWLKSNAFIDLLESLFILQDPLDFFSQSPRNLKWKIEQWVIRNDDWTVDDLFENLGAYTCSDKRFLLLLEGLSSSEVRPDVEQQRRFVSVLNSALRPCQIEIQETGTAGGYPVFTAIPVGKGVRTTPKNLIFASKVKPDLRFSDAINNDIEVVTGRDDVLVYDRPIGLEGLTWRDLQAWWGESNGLDEHQAKKSLYRRLMNCLPDSSPPQRFLFESYFKHFRHSIPRLPALLPEVWLHWDPKTVRERGKDALLRFRMDFLMLLPNGTRIVIEVDGQQHYSDVGSKADPRKYAAMVASDRDLRLAGYDVYRFGAAELVSPSGSTVTAEFFERLFRAYRLSL
jgi:very-short-patch-repair endonuclease